MAQLSQVKWGAVCVTRCVLKQRRKRETCECTPSRVCTYYVTSNPTHPSYSRRHSDVPRRATLSCVWRVHMIRQRQCTRVYVQRRGWSRNVQARALPLQDIPDSPRGMAVWHQPRHWRDLQDDASAWHFQKYARQDISFFLAISSGMSGETTFVPLFYAA